MGSCGALLHYIVQAGYGERLFLWHNATELCYNTDRRNDQNKEFIEFLKLLSDYMLLMQPKTMSAVAGIGIIRFRDTCGEAKKFFLGRKIGKRKEEKQSCLNGIPYVGKCFCCRKQAILSHITHLSQPS